LSRPQRRSAAQSGDVNDGSATSPIPRQQRRELRAAVNYRSGVLGGHAHSLAMAT
jgi:hypothetical protein